MGLMSAEVLREAAALMRSNAEGALEPRGQWFRPQFLAERTDDLVTVADGVHIAAWHPDVALLVADLLDLASTHQVAFTPVVRPRLLAIARAYLGATQ